MEKNQEQKAVDRMNLIRECMYIHELDVPTKPGLFNDARDFIGIDEPALCLRNPRGATLIGMNGLQRVWQRLLWWFEDRLKK